jgi:hypothetical protein
MTFESYLRDLARKQDIQRNDPMPLLKDLEGSVKIQAWENVTNDRNDGVILVINSLRWAVNGNEVTALPCPATKTV